MQITLNLSEAEAKALMNACVAHAKDLLEIHQEFADKTNPIALHVESECENLLAAHREIIRAVFEN